MFWIVNYFWAKEWIHPNTLNSEMSACIPHTFCGKMLRPAHAASVSDLQFHREICSCTNWQWTEPASSPNIFKGRDVHANKKHEALDSI